MANGYNNSTMERMRAVVRNRLREMGISAREASRRAGFNVGYVGDFLEGRSKAPETDRVLKLANALNLSFSEMAGDESSAPYESVKKVTIKQDLSAQHSMVPLLSAKTTMNSAMHHLLDAPAGQIPALPSLEYVRNAYAFTIPNDQNDPRYFAGEVVFISPAAIPRVGDFVFLKMKDGLAGVTRLQEMADSAVVVRTLKSRKPTTFKIDDIDTMHKIVGSLI